jgi:hypothetical protein
MAFARSLRKILSAREISGEQDVITGFDFGTICVKVKITPAL